MIRPGLKAFFRTEQIQDKILVEQALTEAEIEFEIDAPGNMTANAIYQERGPWEFYTTDDRLREAEELVRMVPADNLLTAPQEAPKSTTAQKSWAWIVSCCGSCDDNSHHPEHHEVEDALTTSLDADRPKRLGGRVKADPVGKKEK